MTKSLRKILLSVTAFLAVLFLGLTVAVSVPKTAKAEDQLAVTKITQTYLQAYNGAGVPGGNTGKYFYSSIYIMEFNATEDMFPDYSVGDEIKSAIPEFCDNVYMGYDNADPWGGKANLSATAGGTKIYKHSANSIEISAGRPRGSMIFRINSGATINGEQVKVSTWYEDSDWQFTEKNPGKKVVTIFERPVGSNTAYVDLQISTSYKNGGFNWSKLAGITLNGTPITDGAAASSVCIDYGTDYDAGGSYMAGYIRIPQSIARSGNATLFIPKTALGGLDADQTFVLGYDPNKYPDVDPYNLAIWVEQDKVIDPTVIVSKVVQNSQASWYGTEYEISFANSNVLEDFTVGQDVTAYLNTFTNFFTKVSINGKTLSAITTAASGKGNLIITKKNDTTLTLAFKAHAARYSTIKIDAGLMINGYRTKSDVAYYQDDVASKTTSATFTKKLANETAPDATIFAVGTSASGTFASTGLAPLHVVFNCAPGSGTMYLDNYVFINGKQVAHANQYNACSAAGEQLFGGNTFNLSIHVDEMGTPAVLTFKKGLTVGNVTLSEDISFVSDSNDYNKFWGGNFLPTWTKLEDQQVTFKQGETTVKTETASANITLPAPASIDDYQAGKTFIGWTDGENLYKAGETIWGITEDRTYTAVEIDFDALGAQLRVAGPAGMRFGFAFDTAELSAYKEAGFIQGFGGLIARTSTITELEYAVNDNILIIESTVNVANGNNTEFYVGIWNMYAHNFNVSMSARGYLEVKYTNDANVSYVYSDVLVKTASVGAQELLNAIDAGTLTDDIYTSPSAIAMLNAYVGK